jgi:superfamily II DNA or RNA helicase
MADIIEIEVFDQTYNKIICDPGIGFELNEYFTFEVPGAKFMPAVRNKVWDGKIRLYNVMSCLLYAGLNKYVEEFANARGYQIIYKSDFSADELSLKEATDFIQTLNLPSKYQPRDYQIGAFTHAVRNRRSLLLSPTASGKSFIIYLIARYYNARTLIIVPTTSLVSQLASDFTDYGFVSDWFVHRIFAGQDKQTDKPITISTWQSIYKMPKEYFQQFDVVIGDEAHLFKAKSLTGIMSKLNNCRYRFGFTGTLDGTQTHKLVLEGLFGPVRKVTTTAELIEQEHLTKFKIKAIILKYPDSICQQLSKVDYQTELDFLVRNNARNRFIMNLTLSLKGNTLLLFQFVEKHGKVLYDMMKDCGREVFFVHGGVDGEDREHIRKLLETAQDAIVIASVGTFSTGVNIPSLRHLISASPSKSQVRVLQSIGRVLRKSAGKDGATLYDIADDLTWKNKKNFTITHFMTRIAIYNEENFDYKLYPVNLKDA